MRASTKLVASTNTAALKGRRPNGWERLLGFAILATIACGLVYLHGVDPGAPGMTPDCPVWSLTSLQCPGCGTLRMLHAISHGELTKAFHLNPLAFISLPLMFWFLLGCAARAAGRWLPNPRVPRQVVSLVPVVVIAWGIGRNLV